MKRQSIDDALLTKQNQSALPNAQEVAAVAAFQHQRRQEMIDKLQWNDGGMGHGICAVASSMMWAMSRPEHPRGEDDLKSIVTVSGPPDKYTDEELAALVEFSDQRTAKYDKIFNYRLGANLICINKLDERAWMRKRLSWEYGPMISPTLQEALDTFKD